MVLTLQELLDQGRTTVRLRELQESKWRARRTQREADAAEIFRDWLIETQGVALGDDVELFVEEQGNPEVRAPRRKYLCAILLPALGGRIEAMMWVMPDGMTQEGAWDAYTTGGSDRFHPTLQGALMWLADGIPNPRVTA